MTKPRFTTPRGHLQHPELFGRPGEVAWVQPRTPDEYAGMRAAELQHHLMLLLARRLDELDQAKGWLEERSGLATGRLSKLLRGHAQLTLRDVTAMEGVIGSLLTTVSYSRVTVTDAALRGRFDREP